MPRTRQTAASIGAAVLTLIATSAAGAPTVVAYELVSKKISGRTTVDYTYRVRINNAGNPYSSIAMQAGTSSRATAIVEGDVYLSFIDSGSTVLSDDTFTIRQDRRLKSNLGAIAWRIEGREIVPSTDPVAIVALRFVEFAGVPEHAGWLPIEGNVVTNPDEPGMLQIDLTGQIASGGVELLDATDAVLNTAVLSALTETDLILTDYLAIVRLPGVPFRVRLVGTDKQGNPVDRIWPATFSPTPVSLQLATYGRSAVAGTSLVLPFRITNLGASQQFRLLVESKSTKAAIAPGMSELLLAAGESRTVGVTISLAGDAPLFSGHEIKATVVGLTDASATNHLTATVEVTPATETN